MPLVSVTSLCKRYAEKTALDGVSFSVAPGEIVGLLGPNGAGKTTALHILLGLLAPTSGEALVFGLSPARERHRISERLNFSSAYTTLPSNLKVSENMDVFSMLYGVRGRREKVRRMLETFGIAHLAGRLTGALSSGEKARLNLAKCLLNDPELLLLDEPTASLDPDMAEQTRASLKRIQKERGIGVVYTSHNMREVEAVCDRILFLNEGRVVAEGTPDEVRRRFGSETLEDVFIRLARSRGMPS